MSSEKPLLNRVALLSGALGSIGRAIALELARRGASVSLADVLPQEEAGALLARPEFSEARHAYRRVDVSSADEVSRWIASSSEELGPASIVIPSAAIVTRLSVREVDAESWSRELGINLNGAFHLAQQGAEAMHAAQLCGNVVFLGSWVADRPVPRIVTYCAGKAAQRMLMKCMALEYAQDGIMVNEVSPGYVDAGLTGETLRKDPERRKALVSQTPAGRLIEADEVAFHVANLCDPRWNGVTGTALLLDGGVSLRTN